MGFRTFRFLSVSTLLVTPAVAQFGIPMRKKGSSFQDLNEQAKQQQEGGDVAGLGDMGDLAKMFDGVDMSQMQELWKNALNDPETMAQMEAMGDKLGEAMEQLAKMSPEELQKQMTDAMAMLTGGEMVDQIVGKKDEVLATLEQTGMVSAEELAKFKSDPEYFELKMRESFDQMKGIFSDPEMIQGAMKAMQGGQDMMGEIQKAFSETLDSDEKIEEARLEILKNPELLNNPMMKSMFQSEEFQEVLTDPEKWKASIKEGQKAFASAGQAQGAGVGEL